MAKKIGTLIKEARTQAGMTQEALAKKIRGVSAQDLSLAERGEIELTQAVLKEIAKATGVTQKSLLDAVKRTSSGSTKKGSTSGSAKKSSSSGSAKKGTSSGSTKKTSSSGSGHTSGSSFQLSAAEKKLIQAYRDADPKVQASVKVMLLGTESLTSGTGIADIGGSGAAELLGSLLGSVKNILG